MSDMKLKTSEELFKLIEKAKAHKPTENEIRQQRVSFIFGSLGKSSNAITRDRIQVVLDQQEGKVAG